MIYCPKCKTANRDGSRFCNECGEPFSRHTEVKCPHCGASNSIQSAFCGDCGGRLLSLSTSGSEAAPPIKGLSLPTKASTDDDQDEAAGAEPAESGGDAPAWLRDFGAAGGSEEKAAAPPEDGGAEDVPEWLRDLRDSLPEEPEAKMPPVEESEEEIPDWLTELRPSTEPPATEMPTPAAEVPEAEEVPDWLAELRATEEEAAPVEVADGEVPEAPAEAPEAEEVPDWLVELRATEEEAAPVEVADGEVLEAPAAEDVPDWLAELRATEEEAAPVGVADAEVPEAPAEAPEEDIPDWLATLRPAVGVAAVAATVSASDASEADVSETDVAQTEISEAEGPEALAEVSEEEVPDWLAELRTAEQEAASVDAPGAEDLEALAEMPEEELPPWLAELRAADEAAAIGAEVSGAEDSEALAEMPDWLAELRAADEAAASETEVPEEESAEALAETTEEDSPDWLATLRPAAGVAAAAVVVSEVAASEAEVSETEVAEPEGPEALVETPEEDIPDWLAELPSAEEVDASGADVSEAEVAEGEGLETLVETPAEDLPEWLAELRPAEDAALPEAEDAEALAETIGIEGVPPWLAGIRPGEEAIVPEADAFLVAPELPAGEEEDAPDWLAAIPPAEETDEAETMGAGAVLAAAAVPVWLADLRPDYEDEPAVPTEAVVDDAELPEWLVPTEEVDGETLARADIPDWLLALKPSELREGEPIEAPEEIEEFVEDSGLLAGLSGTLPAEMLIVQPRAATAPVETVKAVDDAHARLYAEIVGQPPAVMPAVVEQPRTDLMALLPRWIIYIALLGVVALPIMLGKPLLPRTAAPVPAMVSDLYDSIDALRSDAPVLVAFDYDPTTSGEMDVVAQTIVGQLMDQKARIVVVSLLPAGPPTAQSLLDRMASEQRRYADGYGQHYVNLGFLPGQASAVWRMGQSVEGALPQDLLGTPLDDLPAMKGITSLNDFDLVVELAASQNTLRWWVEQAVAPHNISLGAGVSAAIEPAARAYYETDPQQLVGLVSGVFGAASYESLNSDERQPKDRTGARLDGQLGGHVIFVLVLLAGAVVYFVRRGTGRER